MHAELHFLTLAQASRLVRSRRVSPVELTQELLRRIDRYDPAVRAFITLTAEAALEQARIAEGELSRGIDRGPLHGIPIAYKDNINTAGVLTTANSNALATNYPVSDAPVVGSLQGGGAICLGKLSMPEFAFGSPSTKDLYPAPLNPWNIAHSAGASSSGPAVAVAAGFAYAAVGTDTGGSIRHPAALCGVVGLKPTYGLVDAGGVIPLSPSQDHVGPLTRSVEDNRLMLQAMCSEFESKARTGIRSARVGVQFKLLEQVGLDPDVGAAFGEMLKLLESLGAVIVPIDSPSLDDINTSGTRIILMEAWSRYGADVQARPDLYGEEFRARVSRGALLTPQERDAALATRRLIEHEHDLLFSRVVDYIVSPAREQPAVTMEHLLAHPLGVRGQLTRVYNLTRGPALVMPMGFSSSGLPLSLQIASGKYTESRLFDFAEELERESGWTAFHPQLAR